MRGRVVADEVEPVDLDVADRQDEIGVLASQLVGLDAVDVDGRIARRRLVDGTAKARQDGFQGSFIDRRDGLRLDDLARRILRIGS